MQGELSAKTSEVEVAHNDIVKIKEVVKGQFLALQKERDEAVAQSQLVQNNVETEKAEAAATLQKFKDAAKERFLALQAERDNIQAQLASANAQHEEVFFSSFFHKISS